jgi:hypothetical protein
MRTHFPFRRGIGVDLRDVSTAADSPADRREVLSGWAPELQRFEHFWSVDARPPSPAAGVMAANRGSLFEPFEAAFVGDTNSNRQDRSSDPFVLSSGLGYRETIHQGLSRSAVRRSDVSPNEGSCHESRCFSRLGFQRNLNKVELMRGMDAEQAEARFTKILEMRSTHGAAYPLRRNIRGHPWTTWSSS